jgi:hypothetical protein
MYLALWLWSSYLAGFSVEKWEQIVCPDQWDKFHQSLHLAVSPHSCSPLVSPRKAHSHLLPVCQVSGIKGVLREAHIALREVSRITWDVWDPLFPWLWQPWNLSFSPLSLPCLPLVLRDLSGGALWRCCTGWRGGVQALSRRGHPTLFSLGPGCLLALRGPSDGSFLCSLLYPQGQLCPMTWCVELMDGGF